MEVLTSTFNEPNSNYFIVIEDNAFKNKKTTQPLMGPLILIGSVKLNLTGIENTSNTYTAGQTI
jgi:hypothetical protein